GERRSPGGGGGVPQLLRRQADDRRQPPVEKPGQSGVEGQQLGGQLAEAGLQRADGGVGQAAVETPDDEVVEETRSGPEVGRRGRRAAHRSAEEGGGPPGGGGFVPFGSHHGLTLPRVPRRPVRSLSIPEGVAAVVREGDRRQAGDGDRFLGAGPGRTGAPATGATGA